MRHVFVFISLAVLLAGLYLMFLYDVPDDQEQTNFFVSRFLIITGIGSLLASLFWKSPARRQEDQKSR